MDNISNYKLRKTNLITDEYTLVVYLDDHLTEFASELGSVPKAKQNLRTSITQIIKENYPNYKITMIKVIFSGAVITSIPFVGHQSTAHATDSNGNTSQVIDSSTIYYHIASGDSLWTISRKFNTSVDLIRRANNLNTNILQVHQQLIIPKAIHTVGVGDYLTVLARDYNVPVDAIKEANGLITNSTNLGQTLIIPTVISPSLSNPTTTQVQASTYSVVSEDSLSVIAKRFETTVDALRAANQLSSDILHIGQILVIPTTGSSSVEQAPTNSTTVNTSTYSVVSGDSLSVIAKRFGITVDALRAANQLSSDILHIGQILVIPTTGSSSVEQLPTNLTTVNFSTYSVVLGDSLSVIAKRFGTTVEALRAANQLSSDNIQIGQILVIPTNGSSSVEQAPTNSTTVNSSTYSVVSGDSLSVIAKRFGTTVDALRATNQLSSDILHIGQILVVPASNPNDEQITSTEISQENRATFIYSVKSGDSLSVIANRFGVTTDDIRSANQLKSDTLQIGQALTIPNGINDPTKTGANTITYTTHTIKSGDNIWDLSVRYGIPQQELLSTNNLTKISRLSIGQPLKIPVHNISIKPVVSTKHGEYLDWWTEAQYVFAIGKTAKITDVVTGKSFNIKRTIGANHADSETVTTTDSNIAKSIWGGYSWTPRAVIVEVDGRKLAASMSFMPHEREYIMNNGITGHFDVYFGNSTRHVDGKADTSHQAQVEKAAGIR